MDLGAGSGRVFLAGFGAASLSLEEVRRFHYPPREEDGHLRWDAALLFREIEAGLRAAGERARAQGGRVRSIGVDSWGVDYGLIDGDGRLLEDPVCYRDARTAGVPARVFAQVPRDEVFARTGIQFLDFNTLFQLHAHAREGLPATARRLLLIPDLVNLRLTGRAVTEHTNASTTQLLRSGTVEWDRELMARLGLPAEVMADIVPAGTALGGLSGGVARDAGLEDAAVVAPATHDTGSAVAGTPTEEGWAYISSGTWSLVGVERETPLVTAEVARANFTNEAGAFGTTRFLKNVTGLWILERCRQEWGAEEAAYARLLEAVAATPAAGLIFPDDPRFLNPPRMTEAIAAQMRETGQRAPESPAALARVVLDSLALRYASVLRAIERLTGRRVTGVRIVGGGSRNEYLDQATADATGLPVAAGPVEATVIGNALVQAVAAGRFASLAQGRRHVADGLDASAFTPRESPVAHEWRRRYEEIEGRFGAAP